MKWRTMSGRKVTEIGCRISAAFLAGIAFALVVNYLGVYILFVSAFPALYVITVLEEHELIDRFGEEYRRYQREVP
jgi:protein-S-isoprenylcysteine O-methyltransferase Ste14